MVLGATLIVVFLLSPPIATALSAAAGLVALYLTLTDD
jgi:hypothetical protein